jgi:signal transduction histidine kinase
MDQNNPNPPGDYSNSALISHLGHDFNNLFSIIIGGLSLMRDEIPEHDWNSELQTTYEDILSATRDASTLITQLNAWAGHQFLTPTSIDVNQLLMDLEPLLEYTIGQKLDLRLNLHPDPLPAFVDSDALQQCIAHLLTNAREAMPNGGSLELRSSPGPCIEVLDQGLGMSDETLRQCKQPFFTTGKSNGKQGFGLSVVDGFTRASGGALSIESELGAGTHVKLLLPTK